MDSVKQNRVLVHLSLFGNNVGAKGASHVGMYLQQSRSLTELDIGKNNIQDEGVEALFSSLNRSSRLIYIRLHHNGISCRGAKAIAIALRDKSLRLEDICLYGNHIGDAGINALAKAIETNYNLLEIDLGDNKYTDRSSGAIVHALCSNKSIERVSVAQNHLSVIGVATAAIAILEGKEKINVRLKGIQWSSLVSPCSMPRQLCQLSDPYGHKTSRAVLKYLSNLPKSDPDACTDLIIKMREIVEASQDVSRPLIDEDSARGAIPLPIPTETITSATIGENVLDMVRACMEAMVLRTSRKFAAQKIQSWICRLWARRTAINVISKLRRNKENEKIREEQMIRAILNIGTSRVFKRKKAVKLSRLSRRITQMSSETFAEIKSFTNPPAAVHQVMRSVLILLGHDAVMVSDWRRCVILIGQTGKGSLRRRIAMFKAQDVAPQLASRILSSLQKHEAHVHEINKGAGVFFDWCLGVCRAVNADHPLQ